MGIRNLESVHQVGFILALAGVPVLSQFEPEMGRFHHRPAFIGHLVGGASIVGKREGQGDVSVG